MASSVLPTSQTLQVSKTRSKKRTFQDINSRTLVLRKLQPKTTPKTIFESLRNTETQLKDQLESIRADALDSRRFYLVFKSLKDRRAAYHKGLKIGNTNIPGKRGDAEGFIPCVPPSVTKDDLIRRLKLFGNAVGQFKTLDGAVDSGEFEFYITFHDGKMMPKRLTIHGQKINIINKDDRLKCSYCNNYGHTRKHCRKRLKIDENKKRKDEERKQKKVQKRKKRKKKKKMTSEEKHYRELESRKNEPWQARIPSAPKTLFNLKSPRKRRLSNSSSESEVTNLTEDSSERQTRKRRVSLEDRTNNIMERCIKTEEQPKEPDIKDQEEERYKKMEKAMEMKDADKTAELILMIHEQIDWKNSWSTDEMIQKAITDLEDIVLLYALEDKWDTKFEQTKETILRHKYF